MSAAPAGPAPGARLSPSAQRVLLVGCVLVSLLLLVHGEALEAAPFVYAGF